MPQAKKASEKKNGAQLTEYVVLCQTKVEGTKVEAWLPVLNQTAEQGPDLQPRVFKAPSKQAAIRQYTGDGPDIIEGTFRAIPLSSWKGGVTTKRVMVAERLPLD